MKIKLSELRQIIREELLYEIESRREADRKKKLTDALSAIPVILSFIGLIETAADASADPQLRRLAQTAHQATLKAKDSLETKSKQELPDAI